LPDPPLRAVVLDTDVAYRIPLATLNIKDYADFAEHDGLIIVGHQADRL